MRTHVAQSLARRLLVVTLPLWCLRFLVDQREVREVPEGAGPEHPPIHGEHGAGVRAVPAV